MILTDCRCKKCDRLLGRMEYGNVIIKCTRQNCNSFNTFVVEKPTTGNDQQEIIKDYEETANSVIVPDKP